MKTIRSNLSFMYRVALFVSYQFATGCKKQIKHNWHSNTPVMSVKSMGWLTTDFVLTVLKNTILWNHFIALQSRQKATNQYYWFYWSHRVNNNFITTQRFCAMVYKIAQQMLLCTVVISWMQTVHAELSCSNLSQTIPMYIYHILSYII